MIDLTDKAVEKVKEFADAEGIKPSIRLKVIGGGCASFKNDISFDDIINELDEVIPYKDITIIVDALSLQYLEGTIIDFVETEFSYGFKFLSDKIKSTCGCGNSVAY